MYDNFEMYGPSDNFISFSSRKKAEWYISKGLADWKDKHQFKLKFSPQREKRSDPYFQQRLENRCVCCGTEKDLTRHHVVPNVFRKLIPFELKAFNYFDILAVCETCHANYELKANELKNQIYSEVIGTKVSIFDSDDEERQIRKIKSAIGALNKHKHKIPNDKLEELKKLASMVDTVDLNKKHKKNWAQVIVDTLKTHDDYQAFFIRWRKHFVEHAKPKYLPELWKVDKELVINHI